MDTLTAQGETTARSSIADRTRDLMNRLVGVIPTLERMRKQPVALRLGIAVAAVVVVGVARLASTALLEGNMLAHPFAFFYIATMVIGVVLGAGAGMAAGAASLILVAVYAAANSANHVEDVQLIEASAFAFFTAVSAWLISIMHGTMDKLRESEELRALLFKEFRHRSRNDLNGLYGLLMMRARRCSTPEAKWHLESAASHTLTLAKVYTRLEKHHLVSGNVVVSTEEYIGGLVDDIRVAHGLASKGIELTCTVEEHGLQFDRAITLGLILNEAIMNSLKHAFGTELGRIHVGFHQRDAEFHLEVSDNGRGMVSKDPAITKPDGSGLGTKILTGLAGQLGGGIAQCCPGLDGRGTMLRARLPLKQP